MVFTLGIFYILSIIGFSEESDKEFDVSVNHGVSGKVIQLPSLVSFQRVTCEVKVAPIEDAMQVNGGKRKQDSAIGDSTNTARWRMK